MQHHVPTEKPGPGGARPLVPFVCPVPIQITPTAPISPSFHGGRAKCLQRLIRLGLPVPNTCAVDVRTVASLADAERIDAGAVSDAFAPDALLSVRPSSDGPDLGGPAAILNIGMNGARRRALAHRIGPVAAEALHRRFVQGYAAAVAGLPASLFGDAKTADQMEAAFAHAAGAPIPQDRAGQLAAVMGAMATAWRRPTARLVREARGVSEDTGMGLAVQEMVFGVGDATRGEHGAGVIQFTDPETGAAAVTGRYLSQSQGREALIQGAGALFLRHDARGPSLEDRSPDAFAALLDYGTLCRARLREEMQIEFTIEAGRLHVLDATRTRRTPRANLRISVGLATDGIIPEAEAVLRVSPEELSQMLHAQVSDAEGATVLASGLAASPGAAVGRMAYSAEAAVRMAGEGVAVILARRETDAGDMTAVHAAAGILTGRGGVTSHAAVIARGLGLPCVVGASDLHFEGASGALGGAGTPTLPEGTLVTLDGTGGRLIAGAVPLTTPATGDEVAILLAWADEHRDLGIRANCDTADEARQAAGFGAEGIGLCRTEHMFLEPGRLAAMHRMIFADDPEARGEALSEALPAHRADIADLLRAMEGRPVCIRLLDPPLHEFVPSDGPGLERLAEALGLSLPEVSRRVAAMGDVNPMLGLRGVRLGLAVPEIYDMQVRAILEAAAGVPGARPEIMVPLVSTAGEVVRIAGRAARTAASLAANGPVPAYRLGVMVETPRAALRAAEIAATAEFLSFGTNDLTQMTYGLSRDDAARFMPRYLAEGVFQSDPFRRLDEAGVGELVIIGAERGRAARADIVLSVCGEHGGEPDSIAFCRAAGMDYVSCSPWRVPVARLAAAHLAIRGRGGDALAVSASR